MSCLAQSGCWELTEASRNFGVKHLEQLLDPSNAARCKYVPSVNQVVRMVLTAERTRTQVLIPDTRRTSTLL